jgi:class 3 adenylate cyclase/predicted ATPase
VSVACTDCGTQLAAGHKFCPECGARVPALGEAPPEVRQATVLLCDIVDSTPLTNRLDPEDARELLLQTQRRIRETVQRHKGGASGAFDRDEGDSQLFCFGLPHAQEDAAERAVAAALEVVAEVACVTAVPGESVHVRIGVATGVVVVGQGPGRRAAITGAAPNLAARLQAAAAPDTVVISPVTRQLLGDMFHCTELGQLSLKGFAEPIAAWRVDGRRAVLSRFDALHLTGSLSPLVGRERELGTLLDCWDLAREGKGQAVAIGGEPGIGKSRMLRVVLDRLQDDVGAVLQLQCSPYHQNTALYPVARGLERVLAHSAAALAGLRGAPLESRLVRAWGRRPADAARIAQVLAVAVEKADLSQPVPSPRHREETIEALARLVESFTRPGPCLLLFEDAQWADPSTLDVIARLVARAPNWPLLILVTHRPEFDLQRLGRVDLQRLPVSRLNPAQSKVLAARLAAGRALQSGVAERIAERSDGIPLFVEELTRATVEAVQNGAATDVPVPVPVPATLRDSLMSRLDRVPAARTVAQIGAVIGREFSQTLLSAVASMPEGEVELALADLVRAGLTSVLQGDDGPVHVFKHALLQDIARDSLLRSMRRKLNATVARTLEQRFPRTAEAQPELLAHYHTEAGHVSAAVDYWKRAGDQAAQRSAHLEAVNQLNRALQLAADMPEGPERRQHELEALAVIVRSTAAAKGYASPEVASALARARSVFPHVADPTHKYVVLRAECQMLLVRARYRPGLARAKEILRLAEDAPASGHHADAHLLIGVTQLYRGELVDARHHLERCLALFDPDRHAAHAVRQGADMGSASLAYLARVLWLLGLPELALQRGHEAVARARRSNVPMSKAQASAMLAVVLQACGDLAGAQHWVDETVRCASEQGQPYWLALAELLDGALMSARHGTADAADRVARGIASYRATGARLGESWALLLLAEGYQRAGQGALAIEALGEALQHVDATREKYYAAEVHRRYGELLLEHLGDVVHSRESLLRALQIARAQQARTWELRAATSLARLWHAEGRAADARRVLADALAAHPSGGASTDLLEARHLLDAPEAADAR